jgi:hypothetical protein
MSVIDSALSTAGGDAGPDVSPGSSAAWAVSFHADAPNDLGKPLLTVGSDTYDGTIAATLPDDLSGGSYQIVIEGMTDEDYAKIRLSPGHPLAARLHLWWKDSPSGVLGDLANFTGFTDPLGAVTPKPPEHSLVAELRVDTLRRKAGERRYEAVIAARERVIARLSEHRVGGLCYTDLEAAVKAVAGGAGITVKPYKLSDAAPGPNEPDFASTAPGPALDAIKRHLAVQARDALKAYGPSVAVIRDGVLHVGKWATPLGAARTLDEEGGLVAVDRGADQLRDGAAGDPPPGAPVSRGTVTMTSLGRPDIKPGDTVHLNLPSADFPVTSPSSLGGALLTALTGIALGDDDPGTPATCLVGSVSHKLSRRAGFVTTIHALVLAEGDDGWDAAKPTDKQPPAVKEKARGSVPADTAQAAAQAVHNVFLDIAGGRNNPRVSEIRKHPNSKAKGKTPPRHTSEVWYADVASDGKPAGSQRVQIDEDHHGELRQVPYLTPFAAGNYGLVLPRYPGSRVLLVNAGGGPDDMVDVGAIWERDYGPPAEAGDYWLALPINVTQLEDIGEAAGPPGDGDGTHDLIDAAGTRVIETLRFVVRVTDSPTEITGRPVPGNDAPAGSVLIETKSSSGAAQIILKADGSITIKGTSITFDSGSGDITLNAANVKVTVSGSMDVS